MGVKMAIFIIYCVTLFLPYQAAESARNITHRMDFEQLNSVKKEDKAATCTSRKDCNFLGVCRGNKGEKYCDCFKGISGDNCEIVDECVNNPGMCGDDPDAACEFHRNKKRAICECETFGKRFDISTKRCVDQKPCDSQKQCRNGGQCKNENSKWEGEGVNYCECKYGTSGDYCDSVDECTAEHCGGGSEVECRYNTYLEKPYCQCMNQNQRFDWPLKKCVDRTKCRTNEDCLPFGVCHNKCTTYEACLDYYHIEDKRSCHCVEGTSGENCEIIDDCYNKVVDCGTSDDVTCDYYYNHGLAAQTYCRCKDRSLMFDPHDKKCKDCNCGENSNECRFKNGQKWCSCNPGYKDIGGVCKPN